MTKIELDDRCAWCMQTHEEHAGPVMVGCEEFVPINWRARAHAILDALIDRYPVTTFAAGDASWMGLSIRLRGAIACVQEKRAQGVEVG